MRLEEYIGHQAFSFLVDLRLIGWKRHWWKETAHKLLLLHMLQL